MHIFSNRLSEVREELGLSQKVMAEKCGVSLRSQQNYEAGERAPDAVYLVALTEAGADVLYILSGKRSQSMTASPTINDRARLASAIEAVEAGLTDTKRHLPPKKKAELVMAAYDLMAQPEQTRDNVIKLVRLAA